MATITIIVPAYNEASGIAETIEGLLAQDLAPGLVISNLVIVANNCTDDTAQIARRYPVTVLEMPDNPHKKSGAMNKAWSLYGQNSDYVFTMDADTVVMPDTLQKLVDSLRGDKSLGAVCARYFAKPGTGLAWRLQRLEYTRYDDVREIRSWRVQVASGAAVLYRGLLLRMVCAKLDRDVPWDNSSLIEDYGLTLDIKDLGYNVKASIGARVLTDTPATFRELWRQRLRWGRGGIDECRKRGWTPSTRRDIMSYGLFSLSMLIRALWVTFIVLIIVSDLPLRFSLLGFIPLAVMWLDRVTSVTRLKPKTWKDRLIVFTLVIEDIYGFFLEVCTLASLLKSLRATRQAW